MLNYGLKRDGLLRIVKIYLASKKYLRVKIILLISAKNCFATLPLVCSLKKANA
jgi:hypothetical protein